MPEAVFLNIIVAIHQVVNFVSANSWEATSRGVDLENLLVSHLPLLSVHHSVLGKETCQDTTAWPVQVWFVWTYAVFMSAWLMSCHVLPAIPLWRPAWTSPATNVSMDGLPQPSHEQGQICHTYRLCCQVLADQLTRM